MTQSAHLSLNLSNFALLEQSSLSYFIHLLHNPVHCDKCLEFDGYNHDMHYEIYHWRY